MLSLRNRYLLAPPTYDKILLNTKTGKKSSQFLIYRLICIFILFIYTNKISANRIMISTRWTRCPYWVWTCTVRTWSWIRHWFVHMRCSTCTTSIRRYCSSIRFRTCCFTTIYRIWTNFHMRRSSSTTRSSSGIYYKYIHKNCMFHMFLWPLLNTVHYSHC